VEMVASTLLEKEVIEGKELDELLGLAPQEEEVKEQNYAQTKETETEEIKEAQHEGSAKPEVAGNPV
ncbi:MAG: hypothetical protein PHT10_09220, partial [Aminobacterium sp.]|nr:hypothetical protein [Aminobacterium sp.]